MKYLKKRSIILALLIIALTSMNLKNHHTFKSTGRQIVLGHGDFEIVEYNFDLQVSDTAKGSFFTLPDGMLELKVNWTSDSNINTEYVLDMDYRGVIDTVEINKRIACSFVLGQIIKIQFFNDSVIVFRSQNGGVDSLRSYLDYSLDKEY